MGGFVDGLKSVGEAIGDTATDAYDTASDIVDDPSKALDLVNPANIAKVAAMPITGGLGLMNDLGIDPFKEVGVPSPVDIVRDTYQFGIETGIQFVQDPEEMLSEGFSKDGFVTRWAEQQPVLGYAPAIVHRLAGNVDHANAAALVSTGAALESAFGIGGATVGALGGPGGAVAGAALGGALGAASRNLFEGGVRDLVPPEVRDRLKETRLEELLVESAVGGATGAWGGYRSASRVAKAARAEGIEELSANELRSAMARDLAKREVTRNILKDGGIEVAGEAYKEVGPKNGLPPISELEAISLITRQRFEDRKAREHRESGAEATTSPEFVQKYDPDHGYYFERNGIVVWTQEEAQAFETRAIVESKGFDSVESYRAEMENSYRVAESYKEAGESSGDWELRENEVLGPFAVRDGEIVWGARDPAEAEALRLDKLAAERGYDNAEAFREDVVKSWRISADLAEESGRATDEWVVREDEILGSYMVKNGRVVFGASTPEEAEPLIRQQIAQEKGFEDLDEYRQTMIDSYRIAHSHTVRDADGDGAPSDQPRYILRENDALGPFVVIDGEIVWGVSTPEEAEQALADLSAPPEERGFDPDGEYETGGGYVVDEADPDDWDLLDVADTAADGAAGEEETEGKDGTAGKDDAAGDGAPSPGEPTDAGTASDDGSTVGFDPDGEYETGGGYVVDEADPDDWDLIDITGREQGEPEPSGREAPAGEHETELIDVADPAEIRVEQPTVQPPATGEGDDLRDPLAPQYEPVPAGEPEPLSQYAAAGDASGGQNGGDGFTMGETEEPIENLVFPEPDDPAPAGAPPAHEEPLENLVFPEPDEPTAEPAQFAADGEDHHP